MRKLLYLAACVACVCLANAAAWRGSAATAPLPNPDDGSATQGIFTNAYFNLSYPLLPGWTVGIAGPRPSISAYYVLATFVPTGELNGTIMVAAQDMFFAAKPFDDLMAMTGEFSRSISQVDGMTIDRPPSELWIAGRTFSRVDFSGVGLFRSTLTTKIRCHFVSFNLTANSPELLTALLRSLDNLGPASDKDAGRIDPTCIGNYADAEHLLSKADPAALHRALFRSRFVLSWAAMAASNMCTLFGPQSGSAKPLKGHWRCGDSNPMRLTAGPTKSRPGCSLGLHRPEA